MGDYFRNRCQSFLSNSIVCQDSGGGIVSFSLGSISVFKHHFANALTIFEYSRIYAVEIIVIFAFVIIRINRYSYSITWTDISAHDIFD